MRLPAQIRVALGEGPEAASNLGRVLALDPTDVIALTLRGQAFPDTVHLLVQDRSEEACEMLDGAPAGLPGSPRRVVIRGARML